MMSKPIRPGCIALIIKSKHPENVGRTVKVLRAYESGTIYISDNMPAEVKSAGGTRTTSGWWVSAKDLKCSVYNKWDGILHQWLDDERPFPADSLIRIDADEDDVQENTMIDLPISYQF